jgi:hypothetical protein
MSYWIAVLFALFNPWESEEARYREDTVYYQVVVSEVPNQEEGIDPLCCGPDPPPPPPPSTRE